MSGSLCESYDACKVLTRRTAGNFYYSFLTLPTEKLRDMCALYAYMRVCDDLGDDETRSIADRTVDLAAWRSQVLDALAGRPTDHPLLPAFADLVARYEIPHAYPLAVIDGVERDLHPVAIETFDELSDYCYHVAGAVGLCCIHVWGFQGSGAEQAAIDCGRAFQLTNILRDLADDAAMGRTYLPLDDLRQFDYTSDDIRGHIYDDRFCRLMAFEVERARSDYEAANRLFDHLKPAGIPIFSAMLRIYGGLLTEIERRNYDVFSSRIALPRWRKLLIAGDTIVRSRWLRGASRPSRPVV